MKNEYYVEKREKELAELLEVVLRWRGDVKVTVLNPREQTLPAGFEKCPHFEIWPVFDGGWYRMAEDSLAALAANFRHGTTVLCRARHAGHHEIAPKEVVVARWPMINRGVQVGVWLQIFVSGEIKETTSMFPPGAVESFLFGLDADARRIGAPV